MSTEGSLSDFDYDLGVFSMQLAVTRVKVNIFLNRGVSSLAVIAQIFTNCVHALK